MFHHETCLHWRVQEIEDIITQICGHFDARMILHLRADGLLEDLEEQLEDLSSRLYDAEDELETTKSRLEDAENRAEEATDALAEANLEGLLTRREYEDLEEHAYQLRCSGQAPHLEPILRKILTTPSITQ